MQVLTNSTGRIIAHGFNLSQPLDSTWSLREIDDSRAAELLQPGVMTLEADGTITVAPDLAAEAQAQADHAAAMERKAQLTADHALIRAAATPGTTITNEHFAALGRQLGVL